MILIIILGVLINWLMLYYELGLGAFLSVITCLAYIGYMQYASGKINKEWFIKVAFITAATAVFIIRDALVFKVLTFLAFPVLFSLLFIEFEEFNFIDKVHRIVIAIIRPLGHLHILPKGLTDKFFKNNPKLRYVALGLIIAIPFLLIIIPLLISSDMILESMTENFFDNVEFTSKMFWRILFVTIFSTYLYAQITLPLIGKIPGYKKDCEETEIDDTTVAATVAATENRTIIVNTFLGVINVVYGLFVFIQVKYLFLNLGSLPEDFTYAEYAREGFFQLLAVTLINILIIIIFEALNHNKNTTQRILENITLVFTMVMSVSAFYRMNLYENTYGYTSLRLLVFMFLIFLIILMALLISYISTYKRTVLNVICIFMMVYYVGSSWFNVDGFVATRNIERYNATGEIDSYYLTYLSDDAFSVVDPFLQGHLELITNKHGTVLGYGSNREYLYNWREWNFQKKIE